VNEIDTGEAEGPGVQVKVIDGVAVTVDRLVTVLTGCVGRREAVMGGRRVGVAEGVTVTIKGGGNCAEAEALGNMYVPCAVYVLDGTSDGEDDGGAV